MPVLRTIMTSIAGKEQSVPCLCSPPWRNSYNFAPSPVWQEALKATAYAAYGMAICDGYVPKDLRPVHITWC